MNLLKVLRLRAKDDPMVKESEIETNKILYFNPQPKQGKKKRKKPVPMPPGRWNEAMERDLFECQNPYHKVTTVRNWLQVHHVSKKSQGTNHNLENLIVICKMCHDDIHITGKLKISGVYPNWKFKHFYT